VKALTAEVAMTVRFQNVVPSDSNCSALDGEYPKPKKQLDVVFRRSAVEMGALFTPALWRRKNAPTKCSRSRTIRSLGRAAHPMSRNHNGRTFTLGGTRIRELARNLEVSSRQIYVDSVSLLFRFIFTAKAVSDLPLAYRSCPPCGRIQDATGARSVLPVLNPFLGDSG